MDRRVLSDPMQIQASLLAQHYVADQALCTSISCAQRLQRPLLIEGEPGVGKTALANAMARAQDVALHRLQCHQALSLEDSCYEWDSAAQLLAVQQAAANGETLELYDEKFLLQRPLLKALKDAHSVLLIDELDRAEESFEALLLEYLGEWQLSIPQYATVRSSAPPLVIITANGERPLSDALRRRCLYHYMAYPDERQAIDILALHHPKLHPMVVGNCHAIVQSLRERALEKMPGIAEGLDLAAALTHLGYEHLQEDTQARIKQLLPTVVKTSRDWRLIDQATLADLALCVRLDTPFSGRP